MGKADEIRAAFAKHAMKYGPASTMLGIVKSVDEETLTCVIADEQDEEALPFEDVRLRPVLDGNESVTLFPVLETWALCVRIESEEDWMVIAVGEVDKVRIIVGDCTFEVKDGYLIKKGEETVKKLFDDLLTAIKAITVNTNSGPSTVPINQTAFDGIKTRADNFFK